MPIIDFDNSKKNLSTSRGIVEYLEKENENLKEEEKERFFNHDSEDIEPEEVIRELDNNNMRLSKKDEKYFSFFISPSKSELKAMSTSGVSVKDYVKGIMDTYAKNFNKGLTGKDLLYFAKVENNRTYKNIDPEVQQGFVKAGAFKEGKQTHIHILVSRRAKNNGPKLSPKDNAKGGKHFKLPDGTTITRGFNMNKFKEDTEAYFDVYFGYNRPVEEKYDYLRLQKHYPQEFVKKYGLENYKAPVDLNKVDIPEKNRLYVQKIVEQGSRATETKPQFERYLKQKGLKITNNKVAYKQTKVPIHKDSMFPKDVMDVLGIYYFNKKLKKSLKKGQHKESDKEQEH